MSDGPFCFGQEAAQNLSAALAYRSKLRFENEKKYRRSNDEGAQAVGVKIVEGQSLFALTFTSYDRISNVSIVYNDSLDTS
jgi:long-subunit fatty acid transport protein